MDGDTTALDAHGIAVALVATNRYLTVATAGADGSPWASPVWFAAQGLSLFVWASKPGARHSLNIAENPRVSLVIFDSSRDPGTASAFYVSADAAQADESSFGEALSIYNARSVEQGLGEWHPSRLRAPAKHRLYVATTLEAYVLDDHDERIPLGALS